MRPIQGIHHITAIASDPEANRSFYHHVLGQRLVKTTVNFDDPATFHLYYGDEQGSPGTIITFFPWKGMRPGLVGNGEVAVVAYAIHPSAFDYWESRLAGFSIPAESINLFGQPRLRLRDPDGMRIDLVASDQALEAVHWADGPIPHDKALRGFHSCTLWLDDIAGTSDVLQAGLAYEHSATDGTMTRLSASGSQGASIIDLEQRPGGVRGRFGAGSVHHVAFRTVDDGEQVEYQEKLIQYGLGVTEVKDRQYFRSIYFREPGGVLFEIATDAPGFLYDEDRTQLGTSLKLPHWLESRRAEIEGRLPKLERSDYDEFQRTARTSR